MNSEKLFIPGLFNDTLNEGYFILDCNTKEVTSIEVCNDELKNKILEKIKTQFTIDKIPYGGKKFENFVPYLINPHSCVKVNDDILYVFFLQAPYFRKFNLQTLENELVKIGENWLDTTISASSNGVSDTGEVYMTLNSSDERSEIYKGEKSEIGFQIYSYNVETDYYKKIDNIEGGLIDNMHQVGYSKNNFLVMLDMNISNDIDLSKVKNLEETKFRKTYLEAFFPVGKLFIYDLHSKKCISSIPSVYTPAHVEFNPNDESIFYVSCHNMSKYTNYMVLHGNGAIIKYQYINGSIKEISIFSEENFYRITTHKIFSLHNKAYIAVAGYPNYLYIIDADSMNLVKKICIFQAEQDISMEDNLYVCKGNKNGLLYLSVSKSGEIVYLVNSNMVYCVNWLKENIEEVKYTDSYFGVSAHIGIYE